MTRRVTVLGDALLDVLARPDGPLVPAGDVPGAVRLRPGGQGANVAVRLARRGLSVGLVSALADDPAGLMLRGALSEEAIEVAAVPVEATGSVVVLVDPAGERTMLSQRAPFAGLVGPELLEAPGSWLVVSGYLLLEPAARRLVEVLAAIGTPVAILGCALPDPARAVAWLRLVRDAGAALVIVNATEAAALLDAAAATGPAMDELSLAAALAADLGAPVVVTGPGGAAAAGPDGPRARVAPASGAGPVTDTTGAGDAFSAAVIGSLATGLALDAALHEGVNLAAAVARVDGAQARVAGEPSGTLET